MNSYLCDPWTGLAQVGQRTRTVSIKERVTREVVSLITSVAPAAAPPARLAAWVRAYWSIENKRHYVRNVTFGEDRSRLRTGEAPQILACLRNLVLTLLHRAGRSAIAAARRQCAAQPAIALALLVT